MDPGSEQLATRVSPIDSEDVQMKVVGDVEGRLVQDEVLNYGGEGLSAEVHGDEGEVVHELVGSGADGSGTKPSQLSE